MHKVGRAALGLSCGAHFEHLASVYAKCGAIRDAPPSASTPAEGFAPLVRAARPKGRPPSGRCPATADNSTQRSNELCLIFTNLLFPGSPAQFRNESVLDLGEMTRPDTVFQ